MTRQILKFPVGRQFREILEDDHEWMVITDMRLNPIVYGRGTKTCIPYEVEISVFNELNHMYAGGEPVPIYHLHTHPFTPGTRFDHYPTPSDMLSNIRDLKYQMKNTGSNVFIVGHGVISKSGIFIVKIPQSEKRYKEVQQLFGQKKFIKKVKEKVKKKLDVNTWVAVKKKASTMDKHEREKINNRAFGETFREIAKEIPDIKTERVGRAHRFNTRVRR